MWRVVFSVLHSIFQVAFEGTQVLQIAGRRRARQALLAVQTRLVDRLWVIETCETSHIVVGLILFD